MGEDPYLASALVHAYITAMQERGVVATAKHFLGSTFDGYNAPNNSSSTILTKDIRPSTRPQYPLFDRNKININIPEKAFWELYLRPFKAAVYDLIVEETERQTTYLIACKIYASLLWPALSERLYGFSKQATNNVQLNDKYI